MEGALDINKEGFRYLHGTTTYELCYQGRLGLERVFNIHGFVDADLDGDLRVGMCLTYLEEKSVGLEKDRL